MIEVVEDVEVIEEGPTCIITSVAQRAVTAFTTEDTETWHRDSQRNCKLQKLLEKPLQLWFLCESLCHVSVFSVVRLLGSLRDEPRLDLQRNLKHATAPPLLDDLDTLDDL